MAFEFLTQYHFEPVDVAVYFTLLLLEGVLSFDNAAILAAMVRRLPEEQRRKALLYGLGGAYVLRATVILFASVIIQYPWLKVVGGAYLLYLCGSHFVNYARHEGGPPGHDAPRFSQKRWLGLSVFWSVVVAVELADVAFALDQVLVAVALSQKVLIIILASFTGILLLRVAAFYVGKLMDWFPALESLAYVAVGYVGLKLVVLTGWEMWRHTPLVDESVERIVSVAVTLCVIVLPVLVKAGLQFFRKPARGPSD